jgi:hypothetical protein
MSRWFRLYDDVVNDPKVQRLPGDKFKAWINLLCIASKHGGALPGVPDVAFILRLTVEKTSALLDELCAAGLIDPLEVENGPMGYEPHNWNKRQYKSDTTDPTAPERNRRYRSRKRNDRNAAVTLTPTRTETEAEAETEQIPEASASGADAPIDHRKRLFSEGLQKLAAMTGKGPDACRSFVGKCLSAASDDAIVVLGLIEDAERNQVVNASAWIAARLKPSEAENGKTQGRSLIAALDRALERSVSEDADLAATAHPVLSISGRSVHRS